MDQELITYLDQRFGENSRQIEGIRADLGSIRADIEGLREESRHTRVQIESLRDEFRLVAEGVMGVEEKLEDFRQSVDKEFREVRALISPAYSGLDLRIRKLEGWRELKERDPLEVLRERYGHRAGAE